MLDVHYLKESESRQNLAETIELNLKEHVRVNIIHYKLEWK
jgi:hypothetical protein